MGSPKALLPWAGGTLLNAHLAALAPFARRLVVVVGADAEQVVATLPPGVDVVYNPDWATSGPSDSARLALSAHADAPALVTPVDVVPASAAVLAQLALAHTSAVPRGPDGRDGHPVVLDAVSVARLLAGAPLAEGLRTLLRDAPRLEVAEPLVAVDFDTPTALAEVRARLR